MKTTLNINLGGMSFIINEDAYKSLEGYIHSYEEKYEDKEIAKDIESRIAELFTEYLSKLGRQIIEMDDVERAIEQIGEPDKEEQAGEATEKQEKKNKRKLYRDSLKGVIAGVSSGLAAYAGVDVSIIRLLWVLMFLLVNPVAIIAYVVMWIILPDAKTPVQRLEMLGLDTTTENIQNESAKIISSKGNNGCLSALGKAFIILAAFFILLALIIFLPIALFFNIGTIESTLNHWGDRVENVVDDDYDNYYATPDSFTVTLQTVYCGNYTPAISGTANNWKVMAMDKVSDSVWVAKIPADKYNEIKFQDTKGDWSNEIEFYDAETQSWQKLFNIQLSPEPNQTFDFTNSEKYRWSRCGK